MIDNPAAQASVPAESIFDLMGILASIGSSASPLNKEQYQSQQLLEQIETRLIDAHLASRHHQIWAVVFACTATLGSFGSALGAIYSEQWRWLLALLAALPLTAVALDRCLLPQQRSRWNALLETRLLTLAGRLKYEDANPAEISRILHRILNEMENQYPTPFPSSQLSPENELTHDGPSSEGP